MLVIYTNALFSVDLNCTASTTLHLTAPLALSLALIIICVCQSVCSMNPLYISVRVRAAA